MTVEIQFSSLAIQRELHINYNVVSYILRALHIKQECEPNYDLFSRYRKNSVETQSLLPSNFAAVGTTTDKNSLENKDFRINIVNYFYINIRQILKSCFFALKKTLLIYGFDDVESVKKCIQR